jgi:hypothetical protein
VTTNAEILAKADEVVAVARRKLNEEMLPVGQPMVQVSLDPLAMTAVIDAIVSPIPAQFAWFTVPDPAVAGEMLDRFASILGSVDNPLDDPNVNYLDEVRHAVAGWSGLDAQAFTENFLSPFRQVRRNQMALVGDLAKVLQGWQTVLTVSRTKIVEVGDRTVAALSALPGAGSLPVALTVVASVLDVLSTIVAGGAGVTVALALFGGGLTISARPSSNALIQGGTASEVLGSMVDAIGLLKQDMADAELVLVQTLAIDAGLLAREQSLAARGERSGLVSPRPRMARRAEPPSSASVLGSRQNRQM